MSDKKTVSIHVLWKVLLLIILSVVISSFLLYLGDTLGTVLLDFDYYVLNYWATNGIELSFGYVALCSLLLAVTFEDARVRKKYMQKEFGFVINSSIFYLFLSFLASFSFPGLEAIKANILEHAEEPAFAIILVSASIVLLFLTLYYPVNYAVTLIGIHKYKEMSAKEYLVQELKEYFPNCSKDEIREVLDRYGKNTEESK